VCLGLKLLVFMIGIVAAEARLDRPFREIDDAIALWNQWDSKHYLEIAASGYAPPKESVNLVFPPLLPVLIRSAGAFFHSVETGAVVVVTLLSFIPGILLYRLARLDLDEDTAFRAALLLLVFPTGFFLHIVYTEGLFLSTVLAAFLAAREGRWRDAALFGALAGVTRINAFLLAPALIFEAWGPSSRGRASRVLAACFVGVGTATYLVLNYSVAGDPLAFIAIQREAFYRTFAAPWEGAWNVWKLARGGGTDSMLNGVIQGACIPLLIVACVASLRQRASYAVWTIGNVLLFASQSFWISVPRLSLALFPLFIWLACRTGGRVIGSLWFAASVSFFSFFAGQFAQGWWVS